MTINLLVDGVQGKAAIYTGSDDLPFSSPLSYPDRVIFHTDLPTIGIVNTVTVGATLAAQGITGTVNYVQGAFTHTLFAHGQAGIPYVEGVITSGLSQPVTLAGSVLVHGFRRVHLGADSTYVYLHDLWVQTPTVAIPSYSLVMTVYVTDYLL